MLNWLFVQVLYSIIPKIPKIPLVEKKEIYAFLKRFKKESNSTLFFSILLSLFVWTITPIVTLFIPCPGFLLTKKLREKHSVKLAGSKIYLLRQTMALLKQLAGLIWGSNLTVRLSMKMDPYIADSGKYKKESQQDNHYSFRNIEKQDLVLIVDYVVVGSGAGGSAVAVELARANKKVAVIEAGPWYNPENYPSSTFGAMHDLFDNGGASVTMGKSFMPVVQASCVGGTPVINSGIVVRTPADVFEIWKYKGIDGDQMREEIWQLQEKIEKELNVQTSHGMSIGNSTKLAITGSEKLGIEGHLTKRNAKNCQGRSQCMQGCISGRKQTPNITWIPEIIKNDGIIISCAKVNKILFNGNVATGVCGSFQDPNTKKPGSNFFVYASKAVIISASATHTPCILERSGLNNKNIGKYFRAHPGSGIIGLYNNIVRYDVDVTQGWSSLHFRDKGFKLETLSLPLELLIGRLPGAGEDFSQLIKQTNKMAFWVAVTRAEHSVGTVKNGFGNKPIIKYTVEKEDLAKLRDGLFALAQMHFAAGANAILPGIYGLSPMITIDSINKIKQAELNPKNYTMILSHLFGGAVMGSHPNTSVCNDEGRVHGFKNLYIADSSLIPTVLGVNPQHTIMALAMRVARCILNKTD